MEQGTGKRGVRYAITKILQFSNLDSLNFYFNLEDKLRQSKTSYNRKKITLSDGEKDEDNSSQRSSMLQEVHRGKRYTRGTAYVNRSEFWLSAVNTFGSLYEVVFQSVYSRTGKTKLTPQDAKQCVMKFLKQFSGIIPFTQLTFFDEGENGAQVLCKKAAGTMKGGSSLDN